MHQRRAASLLTVAVAVALLLGFAGDGHGRVVPASAPATTVSLGDVEAGGKAVEPAPPKPPIDAALPRTGQERAFLLAGWGLALIAIGLALVDLTSPAPATRPLPRRAPLPRTRQRRAPVTGMWLSRSS